MIRRPARRPWRVLLQAIALAALFVVLTLPLVPLFVRHFVVPLLNPVDEAAPRAVTEAARELHGNLSIVDLHADTLLWRRDLLDRHESGHVDLPRLLEGNVALQVFTTVTKSPRGLNYAVNDDAAPDDIRLLAMAQFWPPQTWNSLLQRALFQGERLERFVARSEGRLVSIRSRVDLVALLERRRRGEAVVGALLGTEGSHALEGDLANVDRLYAAGFRLMSLQHFFDNALGGSLHGESKRGLTPFGASVVRRIDELGIVLDLSHSSENVVRDVLSLTRRPVVISHTGLRGHCDTPRNLPDALMQEVARRGGVVGIGYWPAAVCGTDPADVVAAVRYGIELLGVEHVGLGSDFDGTVRTGFDTSQLVLLTQTMLDEGFSEAEIRAVMGDNVLRLLLAQLPE